MHMNVDENSNDFGFSIIDSDDLTETRKSAEDISELVMPLLRSLLKNPKSDMIKWPGEARVYAINEIIEKIKNILDGQ